MEYVVAALVLLLAVCYAVFIAVNIQRGKAWALDMARAAALLGTFSASHHLYDPGMETPPVSEEAVEPEQDRLAA